MDDRWSAADQLSRSVGGSTAVMNNLRPLGVSLPMAAAFVVWMWFGMAGVDYSGGNPLLALRTAGWFVLGSPFIILMAYWFARLSTSLYRRWGAVAALIMLVAACVAVVGTAVSKLPHGRVSAIIGSKLAKDVVVRRLHSSDSFGDGICTRGVFTGGRTKLKEIAEKLSLLEVQVVPAAQFGEMVGDSTDFEQTTAYTNSRSMFFLMPDTDEIAFWYRS
jgi:hypothetical protein